MRCVCPLIALLFCTTNVFAQESYAPDYERHRLEAERSTVVQMDQDSFGDSVDPASGAVSFRHVDIDLKGHGPDLVISRSFSPEATMPTNWLHLEAFADWKLEIPHLHAEMLYKRSTHGSWPNIAGDWTPANRCENPAVPILDRTPPVPVTWPGISMYIPGQSVQKLLKRDSANTNVPTVDMPGTTGGYPFVTTQGWVVTCLPSIKNQSGTQGFLAIDPTGTKYYFDWLASDNPRIKSISAPDIGPNVGTNWQMMDSYLYVSKVEDRFGNYVNYSYSGRRLISLEASDGRKVELTWGARVLRARLPNQNWSYTNQNITGFYVDKVVTYPGTADSRTYLYTYEKYLHGTPRTSNYDAFSMVLKKISLPDGSGWQMNLGQFSNTCDTPGSTNFWVENCDTFLSGPSMTGSISAPSGATANFTLRRDMMFPMVEMRPDADTTWPHNGQMYTEPGEISLARELPIIVSKRIIGGGIDYFWTYHRNTSGLGAGGVSPPFNMPLQGFDPLHYYALYVVNPDGSTKRFITHSIGHHELQGKVAQEDEFASSDISALPIRTKKISYAPNVGPYPARLGNYMATEWTLPRRQWERLYPVKAETTVQDQTQFNTVVDTYDQKGRPTRITRTRSAAN